MLELRSRDMVVLHSCFRPRVKTRRECSVLVVFLDHTETIFNSMEYYIFYLNKYKVCLKCNHGYYARSTRYPRNSGASIYSNLERFGAHISKQLSIETPVVFQGNETSYRNSCYRNS